MKTLKKQFIILLSILFSITVLFTSCSSDDNDNPDPQQNSFADNWGSIVSRDFMGKIVDESKNPIDGVTIKIGGETVMTDANGIFKIKDASVHEKFAYITAEKVGYLKGSRSLVPTNGTNQVKIMLLDENIVGTVPSGSDGQVSLSNGTTVKFDGAFKDANGNAYSGNVTVMMQHLESSDNDVDQKMPGMLYAQNSSNDERALETYGMINVELRGSGGEKLNLADGHTAIIELVIDASQTSAPSTIELWHFDEDKGYWIEDGTATKVGNKYVGEVSHFSWWNCDAQFPTVNLCMNIEDSNGNSIHSIKVELWRAGATYPRTGYSDGNGEICGLIPVNESLTMKVFGPCGNLVFTNPIGPFSTNTNLGVITVPGLITSTITGSLLDCNNNPVADGYVTLKYGTYNELIYTVTNGTFNFTTAACNSLTNFTLEGVDAVSFQSSGVINYTFTPPNMNVGNLITCNAISEYITYQINSEPVVVLISNLNSYVQGSSVSAGGSNADDMLYVNGNSIIPGTYNSPNFDIGELNDRDYGVPTNIQFVLSNVGTSVGDYVDMTFSGTYTSQSAVVKNITGTVHVKRDN